MIHPRPGILQSDLGLLVPEVELSVRHRFGFVPFYQINFHRRAHIEMHKMRIIRGALRPRFRTSQKSSRMLGYSHRT